MWLIKSAIEFRKPSLSFRSQKNKWESAFLVWHHGRASSWSTVLGSANKAQISPRHLKMKPKNRIAKTKNPNWRKKKKREKSTSGNAGFGSICFVQSAKSVKSPCFVAWPNFVVWPFNHAKFYHLRLLAVSFTTCRRRNRFTPLPISAFLVLPSLSRGVLPTHLSLPLL